MSDNMAYASQSAWSITNQSAPISQSALAGAVCGLIQAVCYRQLSTFSEFQKYRLETTRVWESGIHILFPLQSLETEISPFFLLPSIDLSIAYDYETSLATCNAVIGVTINIDHVICVAGDLNQSVATR